MTEEEHELKEKIWVAVHELVDEMTKGLPEEADSEIRQQLTEQFRFWRRKPLICGEKISLDFFCRA